MNASTRRRATAWAVLTGIAGLLSGCTPTQTYETPPPMQRSDESTSPSDPDAPLRLARVTRKAGDLGSAIQLFRIAAAAQPQNGDIALEFGDVQLEAGYPDDAIDAYGRVGTRSSARLGALLGLTRAHLNLGEPAKALDYADQALALGPRDPRAMIDRGVALDTLGRHAEAQQSYRAALAVDPRHIPARNNLALSLALTGQYGEAVALMGPLVRSSSATPKLRENMAVIYGLMGDSDHAAALSRVDLDDGTTQANLAFLAAVRDAKP